MLYAAGNGPPVEDPSKRSNRASVDPEMFDKMGFVQEVVPGKLP